MMVTPSRLQPADQREQLGGFLAGEVGGRLVEDQEFRAAHRGAGGGDQLLLADGEVAEHDMRRQVEAEVVDDLLRVPDHGPLLQDAEVRVLLAEEHVGGDRQVAAKHDFLVHGIDAERHRFMRGRQALQACLPRRRLPRCAQ